ncbi:unnamed protein product, partial [Mesorhabditis spiculigera]
MAQGRELVLKPYVDLVSVGSGREMTKETLDDFKDFGWQPQFDIRTMDESMPRLFALLPCKVSETTVQLAELIEATLRDAAKSDVEMVSARLLLTAKNLVQLFVITANRHHNAAISSVPQQAAVFFNNCYFLAHRLILLPYSVAAKEMSKKPDFASLLSENIPALRSLAANALESMLAQCRRNLSTELNDKTLFTSSTPTGDHMRDKRATETLVRCVDQINAVAAAMRDVLSETVYAKSIGNLAGFLLGEIGSIVLSMEDICEYDADHSALDIDNVIEKLTPLFQNGDYNSMHKMCSQSLFRAKEIAFCLRASLQGIDDRWCEGKGPLADLLRPAEVRRLVKALFANTEQRSRLLTKFA